MTLVTRTQGGSISTYEALLHPPVFCVPSRGDQWRVPSFLGCSVLLSWLSPPGARLLPAEGAALPSTSSMLPVPGWPESQPFRTL